LESSKHTLELTMKKLTTLLLLLCCTSAFAYYPSWTDMTNYVAAALSGYSPGGGSFTNTPAQPTNAPIIFWTNNIGSSFWITNQNFNVFESSLPSSNQYTAEIIVSNSSASPIIATLPFTAYSLSSAANVTGATIPGGSALKLVFQSNPNGVIYVADSGENNQALLSLAAAVASANGLLLSINGAVSSTVTPNITSVSTANGVYSSYYNNYPGTRSGIQFQAYDTLGNVWMNLLNRAGANGMVISNATLDLADMAQYGCNGVQGNDRYEHRSMYFINALNLSGERQFLFDTNIADYFGTNAAVIRSKLYSWQDITTNLLVTGGFVTNGIMVYCGNTNLGPLNTNYIYQACIPPGGYIYTSSNTGLGTAIWYKH
jgi:hypothetical protein